MQIRTVVELAARWYVFFFLNVYGVGKIIGGQFYRPGRMPEDVAATTLAGASNFDLAWAFMGRSFFYIVFIGVVEILGAWLLLWDRTKLIGVAILLPVMINILVFDVIFLDTYGALASATIYTLLLLLIAVCNREAVVRALSALTQSEERERLWTSEWWLTVGLALLAMGLLFGVDQLLVNLLGHGKG